MTDLELPSDLVDEIVDELGLSDEARQRSTEIAEEADYHPKVSRTPPVVAASAVYAAALLVNEKRTQSEVGRAADVSEMSIRKCYPTLLEIRDIPRPDEFAVETADNGIDEMPDTILGRLRRRLGR